MSILLICGSPRSPGCLVGRQALPPATEMPPTTAACLLAGFSFLRGRVSPTLRARLPTTLRGSVPLLPRRPGRTLPSALLCEEPNLSSFTFFFFFLITEKLPTSIFHVGCKFEYFYCSVETVLELSIIQFFKVLWPACLWKFVSGHLFLCIPTCFHVS